MGEYISTSIKIGGKLKRALVPELIELLDAKKLRIWDGANDVAPIESNIAGSNRWDADEVNFGQLEEIITFCHANALPYEHWVDECAGEPEYIQRGMRDLEQRTINAVDREPGIPLGDLRKVENLASGLGTLLEEAKWWCSPIPPLEIVP